MKIGRFPTCIESVKATACMFLRNFRKKCQIKISCHHSATPTFYLAQLVTTLDSYQLLTLIIQEFPVASKEKYEFCTFLIFLSLFLYQRFHCLPLTLHMLLPFTLLLQDRDASLESRYLLSLLLEPNSLLILQKDMYKKHLHGIAPSREEDTVTKSVANRTSLGTQVEVGEILKRSTRVSLTIRHVPKTIKFKLKLGK